MALTSSDALRHRFGIVGGGSYPPIGTFTEYVVVERKYLVATPNHLSSEEAAAWPLGGVTAWRSVLSLSLLEFRAFNLESRAAIVNAGADKGRNILITGAGGGVALLAVQLSVAKGANVFVTSGSDDKIQKLLPLGVKGGVNYKHSEGIPPRIRHTSRIYLYRLAEDWPTQLGKLLQKEGTGLLDAVIDSAGRDIIEQTSKLLKPGAKIVAYGM